MSSEIKTFFLLGSSRHGIFERETEPSILQEVPEAQELNNLREFKKSLKGTHHAPSSLSTHKQKGPLPHLDELSNLQVYSALQGL